MTSAKDMKHRNLYAGAAWQRKAGPHEDRRSALERRTAEREAVEEAIRELEPVTCSELVTAMDHEIDGDSVRAAVRSLTQSQRATFDRAGKLVTRDPSAPRCQCAALPMSQPGLLCSYCKAHECLHRKNRNRDGCDDHRDEDECSCAAIDAMVPPPGPARPLTRTRRVYMRIRWDGSDAQVVEHFDAWPSVEEAIEVLVGEMGLREGEEPRVQVTCDGAGRVTRLEAESHYISAEIGEVHE